MILHRRLIVIPILFALTAALVLGIVVATHSPAAHGGTREPVNQIMNTPHQFHGMTAAQATPPPSPTTTIPALSGPAANLYVALADLVHNRTTHVGLAAAVSASAVSNYTTQMAGILKDVQLVPSVVSLTPNPDGTTTAQFSVKVLFQGGTFPTSIGTVTATMEQNGMVKFDHNALCQLVSPLSAHCPF